MFGSTVLEVAIGMSFCYGFVGLLVTTLQEAVASALRLRARSLLAGVKAMLNDYAFTGPARALYAHLLVNPRDDGSATDPHTLARKPSYIAPQHFAIALVDILQTAPGDFAQLGRDIDALPDPQLRAVLQSLYLRADGELAAFQRCAAQWFDQTMERVSGAYKRRAVAISMALSLLIAVLFNIDSVQLFKALWQHPALAAQIAAAPASLDAEALATLYRLPVGWDAFPPRLDGALAGHAAGWLLTAASSLFGAPLWFELLQRLVNMRGTGDKPRGA